MPIDINDILNPPRMPAPGLSGLTRRYALTADWGDGVVTDLNHLSMLQRETTPGMPIPQAPADLGLSRPRGVADVTLGRIASHDTDFSRWIERVMPVGEPGAAQPELRDVTLAFTPLQAMGQPFRILLFSAWPFDYRIEPNADDAGFTLQERLTLSVGDWRHMGIDRG